QELRLLVGRDAVEPLLPFLTHLGAACAGSAPFGARVVGHAEWLVFPAEPFLGALDLLGAERVAMRRRGAGLGRRAECDDRAAGDQAWPVALMGTADRGGDLVVVQAVDALGRPAI